MNAKAENIAGTSEVSASPEAMPSVRALIEDGTVARYVREKNIPRLQELLHRAGDMAPAIVKALEEARDLMRDFWSR